MNIEIVLRVEETYSSGESTKILYFANGIDAPSIRGLTNRLRSDYPEITRQYSNRSHEDSNVAILGKGITSLVRPFTLSELTVFAREMSKPSDLKPSVVRKGRVPFPPQG